MRHMFFFIKKIKHLGVLVFFFYEDLATLTHYRSAHERS